MEPTATVSGHANAESAGHLYTLKYGNIKHGKPLSDLFTWINLALIETWSLIDICVKVRAVERFGYMYIYYLVLWTWLKKI